jgi:hypothetical protein
MTYSELGSENLKTKHMTVNHKYNPVYTLSGQRTETDYIIFTKTSFIPRMSSK